MIKIEPSNFFDAKAAVIINSANTGLLRGSGLCGPTYRKASERLEAYCKKSGGRDAGSVIITPSFQLSQFDFIIHACGPKWSDGCKGETAMLKNLYQNIFSSCLSAGIESVAVPALSTGLYRFPIKESAAVAFAEAVRFQSIAELTIICVNPDLV